MVTSSLFANLEEIVSNLEKGRLADVFRFISFKPFETFGPHQHVRIEINFVKKGSCILRLDNESVTFGENEIMIISSNVNHIFEAGPKGTTLMQLEFLPEIFDKFNLDGDPFLDELAPVAIFSERNRLIKIVNNVRIVQSVQRILNELDERGKYYHYLVIMYYAELLVLIFRHLDKAFLPVEASYSLKKAIDYIRKNFNADVTIEEVASYAGVGERYLRKLFARQLNMSPLEYLNQIRLNKAIELLRSSDLTIKEVSFMCGFKSPQYFSRVFKHQMGFSPKGALSH